MKVKITYKGQTQVVEYTYPLEASGDYDIYIEDTNFILYSYDGLCDYLYSDWIQHIREEKLNQLGI
jgi:hypothetical protein